jgi:predicted DNA binding protein
MYVWVAAAIRRDTTLRSVVSVPVSQMSDDTVRETVLGVRHVGCPVSDVSARRPSARLQYLSRLDAEEGDSRRLLSVRATEPDAVVEALAAHDRLATLSPVSEHGSGGLYCSIDVEYSPDNPSVSRITRRHGCYQHPVVTIDGGIERWTLYTRGKSKLADVVEEIRAHDNRVEVVRTTEAISTDPVARGLDVDALRAELTPRQRDALGAALSLGHYDRGRDATVADVADRLGVHETTAWEHLDKAESRVLGAVAAELVGESTVEGDESGAESDPATGD